jgi:hypothetical protein
MKELLPYADLLNRVASKKSFDREMKRLKLQGITFVITTASVYLDWIKTHISGAAHRSMSPSCDIGWAAARYVYLSERDSHA